jgi:hypothetical protein
VFSEIFVTPENGTRSTIFTLVVAELFPGTGSGLKLLVIVAEADRVEPLAAFTWAVTTRVINEPAGTKEKLRVTVPPSEVPGLKQSGKQEANETPEGSVTDIVGKAAASGPRFLAETAKLTY